MDRHPLENPATVFIAQARSAQMRRFIDNLTGFPIEDELPEHLARLLEKLDSAQLKRRPGAASRH